jgi:hypothetical protein
MKNQNSTRKSSKKSTAKKTSSAHINPETRIIKLVKENTRRPKSFGFKSLQIVLKARKPLTVAEFQAAGGRLKDLHWDAAHKNVRLAKAS